MEPSLIASMAYSTWKRRPSGEKVFTPRSYSLRVRYIFGVDLYVSLVDCRRLRFDMEPRYLDHCPSNFGFDVHRHAGSRIWSRD